MSKSDPTGFQTSGTTSKTEAHIEGPIAEFDKYGDYTGYKYVRCTGCGIEAMRRRDLQDGGCECNSE